jgi:hypothetical protein
MQLQGHHVEDHRAGGEEQRGYDQVPPAEQRGTERERNPADHKQ